MRNFLIMAVLLGCAEAKIEDPLLDKQMKAIELIQHSEGLRLKAYKCNSGRWSIGYGTESHKGEIIDIEQASKRMQEHLNKWVFPAVKDIKNTNEYVAFASYKYNTGKTITSCKEILTRKGGFTASGKWSNGLYKRRISEYSICAGVSKEQAERTFQL
jgi:GH24 family phage-related lysozyme (muramidase)